MFQNGEVLDAFVWGNLGIGGTSLNVKLGRHAQLWGEAVFPVASANSVAFSQAPTDGIKQSISPGATAKEITLPTNQVTANWQLTDRLSLSSLYTFEWRQSRFSEGGTYFGSDAILFGPPVIGYAGRAPIFREPIQKGVCGNYGIGLRWRPGSAFLDSRNTLLGVFYRRLDDSTGTWLAK